MLLKAQNLSREFGVPKKGAWFGQQRLRAVDSVSLELEEGRTLGLVGESGSGKSTLGRLLLALDEPSQGCVEFEGRDLYKLGSSELKKARRHFQMVFQDPMASINPRQKAWEVVSEPLVIHDGLGEEQARSKAAQLLLEVGLDPDMRERWPHEFSGGQRQRLMIARAVSTRPKLLVADEPVSSLDITIQAQILDLLEKLKKSLKMAMIFISHDLRVVERLSDEVAVMKDGKIIEYGLAARIYASPAQDYTKELLSAALPLPASVLAAVRRKRGRQE